MTTGLQVAGGVNAWANTLGRRVVTPACIGGLVILVGVGVGAVRSGGPPGSISQGQYASVQLDESRTTVLSMIGRPGEDCADADHCGASFDPEAAGTVCDYYSEGDTLMDPGVMRFCFASGRLVEKASYDLEGGHEVCMWDSPSQTRARCAAPRD